MILPSMSDSDSTPVLPLTGTMHIAPACAARPAAVSDAQHPRNGYQRESVCAARAALVVLCALRGEIAAAPMSARPDRTPSRKDIDRSLKLFLMKRYRMDRARDSLERSTGPPRDAYSCPTSFPHCSTSRL